MALAEWLNANPDFSVELVGYADKGTGTAEINQKISAKRAEVVKSRLLKLGVPAEKMTTDHKGDTVQPFAENDKNRVVISTVK